MKNKFDYFEELFLKDINTVLKIIVKEQTVEHVANQMVTYEKLVIAGDVDSQTPRDLKTII